MTSAELRDYVRDATLLQMCGLLEMMAAELNARRLPGPAHRVTDALVTIRVVRLGNDSRHDPKGDIHD